MIKSKIFFEEVETNNDFAKMLQLELIKKDNEIKQLKNFITDLISELSVCALNGTNKLDIVSDYIKQEYEKVLKEVNK